MKFYILHLLGQCTSLDARILRDYFSNHRLDFKYDEKEDTFFHHISINDAHHEHFKQFWAKSSRSIEGTCIRYRVADDYTLHIWLE